MVMYDNLRTIRKNLNVSAEEMAELLGLKTKGAYYKKENGDSKISIEEAKIIAVKLGKSIEEIFFTNMVSIMETKHIVNDKTGTDG